MGQTSLRQLNRMRLGCHQAGHPIRVLQAHPVECHPIFNIRHRPLPPIHRTALITELDHLRVHHTLQQARLTVRQARSTRQLHRIIHRHRQITIRRHRATRPTLHTLPRRRRTARRAPSSKQQVLSTQLHIHQRVLTRRLRHRTARRRLSIHRQVRIIRRRVQTMLADHHRLPQRHQATVRQVPSTLRQLRCTRLRAQTIRHRITLRALHRTRRAQPSTVLQVRVIAQRLLHTALLLNTHLRARQVITRLQAQAIPPRQEVPATVQLIAQEARNILPLLRSTVLHPQSIPKKTPRQVHHIQVQPPAALKKNSNNSKTNTANAGKKVSIKPKAFC